MNARAAPANSTNSFRQAIESGNNFNIQDIVDYYSSNGNRHKCLKIRGLPFKVKKKEIIDFFKVCVNVLEHNVIIEKKDGKATGHGLVIFENDTDATTAIDNL